MRGNELRELLVAVVGILIFFGVTVLLTWLAYFAIQVTIGIWFPARASNYQRTLVRSPGILVAYPMWRWLAPFLSVSLPLGLLRTVFELIRVVASVVAT